MFPRILAVPSLSVVLIGQLAAAAQTSSDGPWPAEHDEPVSPLPLHRLESSHHDSTAVGNTLRGCVLLIHAEVTWGVNVSQAEILGEPAPAVAYCNRCQWTAYRLVNRERLAGNWQPQLEARRLKNQRDALLVAAYP